MLKWSPGEPGNVPYFAGQGPREKTTIFTNLFSLSILPVLAYVYPTTAPKKKKITVKYHQTLKPPRLFVCLGLNAGAQALSQII